MSLQPLQMDLLCRLAREPFIVIGRDILIKDVWPRRGVEDDVLSRSIAEIRSALDDDARKPRFIETVPRRGYRLLVAPRPIGFRFQSGWLPAAISLGLLLGWMLWLLWPESATRLQPDLAMGSRQITADVGLERVLSTDSEGQWMAFLSTQASRQEIVVARNDGSEKTVVTEGTGIEGPDLSPDGRRLAYVHRSDSNCRVLIIDIDQGDEHPVADCWQNGPSSVAFSNTGDVLAHTVASELGRGIGLLNHRTGEVRILTHPGGGSSDRRPRFSPDGRWLSFSRGDDITRELFRQQLAGGEPQQLTFDQQLAVDHSWIDGNHMVYASDRLARQSLWWLDIAEGSVEPLGAVGAYGPYFQRRSHTLYYEQASYEANLWRVDLKAGDRRAVPAVQSSRYDNHPVFSADGRHLAFISNRSGLSALWLADADGADPRKRYEVSEARVSRPAFSPEGHLLVSVYTQNGSQLHELPVDNEPATVLTAAGSAASSGIYSADGRLIYYLDERDGSPAIWRIDRATGRAEPFDTLLASRIQFGGDGRIYFTRTDVAGIFSLDLVTGSVVTMVDEFPVWRWNHWCIAGHGLYYSDGEGVLRLQVLADSPARQSTRVSDLPPTAIGIALGVNPEETMMYLSRTDDARIDIHAVQLAINGRIRQTD